MSSFDRIKSFWRTSSDIIQQSILDKTQNFIASSFRRSSIPTPKTQQFDDYLSSLPYIKKHKKSKQGTISSLKPQLVKKCYENVQKQYFNQNYQIDHLIFQKKTKVNLQKQSAMQEQLDQVQVCLFNQISSRFDQILSVLRTIQALDLLVVQSQKKIKEIREDNLSKVIAVSEKQNKLSALIRRKKNLQQLMHLTQKLKQYKKFKQLQEQFQTSEASQQFYTIIPQIKTNTQIYKKLKSTKNAILFIDQAQNNLKRSFAQKINQKIFQYLKKDIPYQIQFWKKNINRNNIMQDRDEDSRNTTGLLDQSAIIVQQDNSAVIAKKQQNIQYSVIQYIKKGWQDGQYSVGKFKSDIDALLKSKHNAFMLDFRNFCDQICKKHDRHIENPSLTNLLHQISITFCIKVYNYFFDIHKSMILRYFSTNQKLLQFVVQLTNNNLSIIQKQKIKFMADGFVSSGSFIIRIIIQKLIDIIDTKVIHEGIDISEIKQIIAVMQNAQIFLQKQIDNAINITNTNTQDTFLSEFFKQLKQKYPIQLLQVAKKRKLMDYLNKMHKNSLTVQLKQSLENQIWQPTDIPTFYYDSLHYLITGQSLNLRRNKHNLKNQQSSMMFETSVLMDNQSQSFFQQPTKLVGNFRIIRNDIIINGQTYKVTQTLLLLLQMLEDYMTLAQNFPVLKGQIGIRINQLIRSYNMSSCQLIVHAGAVALQKLKTKNITSKHLALSSLSLKFILYIMQCLEKRVEILDYTKLKQSIEQHIDIIIKKLNQILVYKANSSKPDINLKSTPSKGTESIVSSTKILLQILSDYYGKQSLNRIFTKQVFNIYIDAISIIKVHTRIQAQALKDDVAFFFGELKGLQALDNGYEERRLHAEDLVRRAFEEL